MPAKKDNQPLEGSSIEQSLRQIANCLAYLLVSNGDMKDRSKPEAMQMLEDMGFDRKSIASIFQTSPEVVKQNLYMLRSSKKTGRAKNIAFASNEDNTTSPAE